MLGIILGDSAQNFWSSLRPEQQFYTLRISAVAATTRIGALHRWLRTWRARIAWAVHCGIELSLERRMQLLANVGDGKQERTPV